MGGEVQPWEQSICRGTMREFPCLLSNVCPLQFHLHDPMSDELQLLILRFDDERAVHRRREALLASLVLHLLLVIFILAGPRLFSGNVEKRLSRRDLIALEDPRQLGLLALPKDHKKIPQKPKTPIPSDKDRITQGKSPLIDPRRPEARNSESPPPAPEQSTPPGPLTTPPPPVPPSAAGGQAPSTPGGNEAEGKQIAKLQSSQSTGASAGPAPRSFRE